MGGPGSGSAAPSSRYLGLVGEIAVTVVLIIVAAILLTSMSLGTAADSLADRLGLLAQRVRGGWPGLGSLRRRAGGTAEEPQRAQSRPTGLASMFEDRPGDDPPEDVYIDLRRSEGGPMPAPADEDAPADDAAAWADEPTPWAEPAPPVIEVPQTSVVEGLALAAPATP